MSMDKNDSKGTIKSYFVTSCITFKGLIPTNSFPSCNILFYLKPYKQF